QQNRASYSACRTARLAGHDRDVLEATQRTERHLAEDVETVWSEGRRRDSERVIGDRPSVADRYERNYQQRREGEYVRESANVVHPTTDAQAKYGDHGHEYQSEGAHRRCV